MQTELNKSWIKHGKHEIIFVYFCLFVCFYHTLHLHCTAFEVEFVWVFVFLVCVGLSNRLQTIPKFTQFKIDFLSFKVDVQPKKKKKNFHFSRCRNGLNLNCHYSWLPSKIWHRMHVLRSEGKLFKSLSTCHYVYRFFVSVFFFGSWFSQSFDVHNFSVGRKTNVAKY